MVISPRFDVGMPVAAQRNRMFCLSHNRCNPGRQQEKMPGIIRGYAIIMGYLAARERDLGRWLMIDQRRKIMGVFLFFGGGGSL